MLECRQYGTLQSDVAREANGENYMQVLNKYYFYIIRPQF